MRRITLAALAAATLLAGCGEDPTTPPPRTQSAYEDLTKQWHPLHNLEEALSRREIGPYRDALDAEHYRFVFPSNAKWIYTEDTEAAARLLDPQLPEVGIRAVAFDFDLVFDERAIQWTPVESDYPPGETWYEATMGYTFYIQLGDGTECVQPPAASVRVTIRQDPGDGKWRIVRITEMPFPTARAGAAGSRAGGRVETKTLGEIKALYAVPSPFQNLTEIWHPLVNLEEAIQRRDIDHYREALDPDYYTFFFSAADYSSGKTPESWTYAQDTYAAAHMLDPQLPEPIRAVTLEFDLVWDILVFSVVQPDDPADETWYRADIGYTYYVRLGDGRGYVQAPGASAWITVRRNPDDGLWRIVQMHDMPETLQAAVSMGRLARANLEASSFGQIKALYGE